MANDIIDFLFRFHVKEGQQATYEQILARQLVITTKKDPGVLLYEITRDSDGSYCQHERYENEAALLLHVKNTDEELKTWIQVTERFQTICLGALSEEFRKGYDGIELFEPYLQLNRPVTTGETVELFVTVRVKEGQEASFEQFAQRLLAFSTAQEPGLSLYRIFRQDASTYVLYQRFVDSAAANAHFAMEPTAQAATGGTWLDWVELSQFLMLGAADEQLLGLVQEMNALAYAPYRKVVR